MMKLYRLENGKIPEEYVGSDVDEQYNSGRDPLKYDSLDHIVKDKPTFTRVSLLNGSWCESPTT